MIVEEMLAPHLRRPEDPPPTKDPTGDHSGGKINVCIVTPYPLTRISGISQFVRNLARVLRGSGVEVEGWCPGRSVSAVEGGIRPIPVRGRFLRDLELAAKTIAGILEDRASIRVVHAQQLHAQSAGALLAARLLGRAGVLTVHVRVPTSGRFRALLQRLVDRICFLSADYIVAVSLQVAATLPIERVKVIPNGVDTEVFRPSNEDRIRLRTSLGLGSDKAIVFAGRWSRTKGLDTLFAALQQVASNGVRLHLILIGEPAPDEDPIQPEAFLDSAAFERIHLLGRLKDSAEVAALFSAADAFVLPSLSEGMPLALLEALASGLPIIASDIPVHRALIHSCDCGWLVAPGDAGDLARVLATFALHDPSPEWAMRAREAAVRHHSLQAMVEEYRTLYADATARRSLSPSLGDSSNVRGSDPY